MARFSFWVFLGHLMLVSCIQLPPDPDPELPLETQEGLNTLGMNVNGFVFEARGGSNNNPHLYAYQSDNVVSIKAYDNIDSEDFTLFLRFKDSPYALDTAKYVIWDQNQFNIGIEVATQNPSFQGSSLIESNHSFIRFTKLDGEKKIISGTFEFDIKSEDQDTLLIRDGRFDVIVH